MLEVMKMEKTELELLIPEKFQDKFIKFYYTYMDIVLKGEIGQVGLVVAYGDIKQIKHIQTDKHDLVKIATSDIVIYLEI